MNLYQLNSGVDPRVLQNANYDIRTYTEYIEKAIGFLKKETHAIRVTKLVVDKEIRYYPLPPTNKKEEKAIDLLFNENTKYVYDQNRNFYKEDSISIIDQNEDDNFFTLSRETETDIIYLKPDTYQLEQQKKALDNLRYRPLKEHQPLLDLFGFPDNRIWLQNHFLRDYDWKILKNQETDGVFEQREFVSKAMQTKDFALLEGPPGSGKTTTIIELIMQLTSEGKRVLLCSATHAAIDNVIERIKGRYKDVCDKEIVPVRISRSENSVKESVRPYLLSKLVATYKIEIEKHLKGNQQLDSQKYLLKNLHQHVENENDPIEKIILDSANLVAGTMIGILQHPDIRANKHGAGFDVLIVDEASKVTFCDFIVPALHAKKWILVGDVKQLSPYVENDYVSENISKLIDAETQKAIVKQFELRTKLGDRKFDDCLKVFFTDQNLEKEKQILEANDLVIETVTEKWEINEYNLAMINAADVIIAKNDAKIKQLLSNHLHVKAIFINGEINGLSQQYRQEYLRKSGKTVQPYLFDSRNDEWSEVVASRLNQNFSFRNAGVEFDNIGKELTYLVPSSIQEQVSQIKRLVFPSILELLQNGIGKNGKQTSNRVLSDGFYPYYKNSRFVSLTYQHRMQPDIAVTSKENFYGGNNLKPANTVVLDRGWKYEQYGPVVKWIHNNDATGNKRDGKIVNPTEANDIERELIRFLSWAKENPKADDKKYEVAVLTFYLNQEGELRKKIRRLTGSSGFSKFHKNNTDIYLYTVDKFQGQEADLVLLGFTKFTKDAHYNSPNRLNVALTRARHKLILFGNKPWFKSKAKLKALRDLATNFESTIKY